MHVHQRTLGRNPGSGWIRGSYGRYRWPHSGHTAPRKTGRRRKTARDKFSGQTACAQVVRKRDTIYGSEGWGFESLRARPGHRLLPALRRGLFRAVRAMLGAIAADPGPNSAWLIDAATARRSPSTSAAPHPQALSRRWAQGRGHLLARAGRALPQNPRGGKGSLCSVLRADPLPPRRSPGVARWCPIKEMPLRRDTSCSLPVAGGQRDEESGRMTSVG